MDRVKLSQDFSCDQEQKGQACFKFGDRLVHVFGCQRQCEVCDKVNNGQNGDQGDRKQCAWPLLDQISQV